MQAKNDKSVYPDKKQKEKILTMDTTTISFEDLMTSDKYNNDNSAVIVATIFDDNEDWEAVNDFLANQLGFSKDKNLIGVHRITGNILGDEGRTDYLLVFDNEDVPFNFMARLRFSDIKWTDDFIDNYKRDFIEE